MKSIILAGGIGSRLWPLSREYYPKQFIQIEGRSLFQMSFQRAARLSLSNDIFVVTNEIHQYLVRDQVEEIGFMIPDDHLLLEPVGRNTLPAIALAMQRIRSLSGPEIAVVLPSDHLLADEGIDQIRSAEPLAENYLVTFGICPKSPHTGYGYIKPGKPVPPGFIVDEFKEKPDELTARQYVENGYLWNSGIFLLSTDRFFEELKHYCPGLFEAFGNIINPDYETLPAISIDYGLLERSTRVVVVPIETAWSDLGTFRAFFETSKHDTDGNVGKADYIDATNNYVHAPEKHVGLIGVHDLVVVDTADALLVCDNRQTEQVKQLVSLYNKRGNPVTRFHRKVHRPWGTYTVLEDSGFYKIKRVTVKAGKKLSLQLHHHRSEHWVVVSGTAEVTLNGETSHLNQGESTFVREGMKHRLRNPGPGPLEIIEVQFGEYLDEDDIVRFEDDYGRK